jgi:hypothetical protein
MLQHIDSIMHGIDIERLEHIREVRLSLHLLEKAINATVTSLADEFDHELDVTFQGSVGCVEGAAKDACIPSVIDDKELGMKPIQDIIAINGDNIIFRLDRFGF